MPTVLLRNGFRFHCYSSDRRELPHIHVGTSRKNGMNISENQYDTFEKVIFEDGLRIKDIYIHPELDLMLLVLNNRKALNRKLSSYPLLAKAKAKALNNFEFVGEGVAVFWPDLDEDLSLKGFLQEELALQKPVLK